MGSQQGRSRPQNPIPRQNRPDGFLPRLTPWPVCSIQDFQARANYTSNHMFWSCFVDITPAENAALPMSGYAGRAQGFQGIHDHIYVRAIVLSDGTRQAALVAWELIGVPNAVWENVSQRIANEVRIPVENLVLAGVHDHGRAVVSAQHYCSLRWKTCVAGQA